MNGMNDPIYLAATLESKSDGADSEALFRQIEGCVKDISLECERLEEDIHGR